MYNTQFYENTLILLNKLPKLCETCIINLNSQYKFNLMPEFYEAKKSDRYSSLFLISVTSNKSVMTMYSIASYILPNVFPFPSFFVQNNG